MNDYIEECDVLVIGGGPAGLSAAFWCKEFGLRPRIFEREKEFGGQLLWTHNSIRNYLGIEVENGVEMRDRFLQHIEKTEVAMTASSEVAEAHLADKIVILKDGKRFRGRAIVIATGVRRRRLNIPGEREFKGRGILGSGVHARNDIRGKKVVIVGGGDAAFENALLLSKSADLITLVHRSKQFSARKEFVDPVLSNQKIQILRSSGVKAIEGNESVESVYIEHLDNKITESLAADAVLIRIGVEPNSELSQTQLETDQKNFILTDKFCRTSVESVFAIGDVASGRSMTISRAVGEGAVVGREILNSWGNSTKIDDS